jgi:protein-disulfide isomerase
MMDRKDSRAVRQVMAVALLALATACGGGEPPPPPTDATTRALLGRPAGDGPATMFDSLPSMASQMNAAYLPQLGYNRGDVAAPIKVIEFSDFGCGFCRRFHEESFPTLKTQFIDTGMIEWKLLPFITGTFPNSLAVTEASECALEQSVTSYETFGGNLWVRQAEWKESGDPAALARTWATEAGLDMPRFDSCLAEDRRIDRVAGATAIAQQLGVRATPTFWIVGYGPLQGALPLDVFQGVFGTIHAEVVAVLDSAAADSASAPAPGA